MGVWPAFAIQNRFFIGCSQFFKIRATQFHRRQLVVFTQNIIDWHLIDHSLLSQVKPHQFVHHAEIHHAAHKKRKQIPYPDNRTLSIQRNHGLVNGIGQAILSLQLPHHAHFAVFGQGKALCRIGAQLFDYSHIPSIAGLLNCLNQFLQTQ